MEFNKERDHKILRKLLTKAQNGDMDAFQRIYDMTARAQYIHIHQILSDTHEAQDALQETYLLLYQNLEKIHPPSALLAYLNQLSYYVSKNIAKYKARREHRTVSITESEMSAAPESGPLEYVENKENSQILRNVINSLPEQERGLIIMRYYQKLSMQDIARSLDVSLTTAYRLYHSAKAQLKIQLERQDVFAAFSLGTGITRAIENQLSSSALPPFSGPVGESGIIPQAEAPLPKASKGILGMVSMKGAAAFACMCGCALAVVKSAPSAEILSIKIPESYCASPAEIEVQIKSVLPIRQVTITTSDGQMVNASAQGKGLYRAFLRRNGTFTVRAAVSNGRTVSEKGYLAQIDTVFPEAELLKAEDNKLWAAFTDSETGIDSKSLLLRSKSGLVTRPFTFDRKSGVAVFNLSEESQTLYFSDLAGNRTEIPVDFERPGRN